MELSIIIPTYNRSALLKLTLESIVKQKTNKKFEVIVCDDGSIDNTEEIVLSYRDILNIKYHYQEDRGFRAAKARNMGIEMSQAPICLFVDTGILLKSNVIEVVLKRYNETDRDIAVIGNIYGFDDYTNSESIIPRLICKHSVDDAIKKLKDEKMFDVRQKVYNLIGDNTFTWPVPWIIFWTGFLAVRTDTLKKVGKFDENYISWGGEDTDLSLALYTGGIHIEVLPQMQSIDYPHKKENYFVEDKKEIEKNFKRKLKYIEKKYNLSHIKGLYKTSDFRINQEILNKSFASRNYILEISSDVITFECIGSYIEKIEYDSLSTYINKFIETLELFKDRVKIFINTVQLDRLQLFLIKQISNKLGSDAVTIIFNNDK